MQKIILVVACCFINLLGWSQVNITKAEYFFNSDPGFGNGINVPIVPAVQLDSITISADISALPLGLNNLYLRSRDANGKWSYTNRYLFVRTNRTNSPNITKSEYFIDADPGFGNAIDIPLVPSTDVINTNFNVNLVGVTEGLHSLYIRSRDADGLWSVSNRFLFVRAFSNVQNITQAEYFFDTDPGFGNASAIPITPGSDLVDISVNLPITSLSEGLHSLYIRSKDANGKWSLSNRFLFVRAFGNVQNITQAEYFFDTDPGFGNGSAIPIIPGSDLVDIPVNLPVSSLSEGLHALYIRSRDANGKWSFSNRFLFVKTAAAASTVTQVEYFIDTDPGFGNGIPVAMNAIQNLSNKVIDVNITNLVTGTHRLFIRSRDNNGKWSLTNIYDFPISALVVPPAIVVNSVTNSINCSSIDFLIGYHVTGTYNSGNVFTVQLSDVTGSFASTTNIGSFTSTGHGIINATIPGATQQSRIRIVSSDPVVTGITSSDAFALRQPKYSDTVVYIGCLSETYNLNTIYDTHGFTVEWNTPTPEAAAAGTYNLITTFNNCKDTAIVMVKQDVFRWMGNINNDWHNALNWNTLRVPDQNAQVIVSTGTVNIFSADADAASVQVKTGATVNVQNNRKLHIHAKCDQLPPKPRD